jgi:hypothetical protein
MAFTNDNGARWVYFGVCGDGCFLAAIGKTFQSTKLNFLAKCIPSNAQLLIFLFFYLTF